MERPYYSTRIYYDDTDAGGVVYYANYLRLYERAKQEFFLKHDCDLFKLHAEDIYLIVKEIRANYIKSIKLGDKADVYVNVKNIKKASLTLHFEIKVDKELMAEADILNVCVKKDSNIVKLPECVKNLTAD